VVAGKSTKQIAFELQRVAKTVEYHRKSLMRKLDASNVAELVRLVAMAAIAQRRPPPRGSAIDGEILSAMDATRANHCRGFSEG
jgi:hypothetical protein